MKTHAKWNLRNNQPLKKDDAVEKLTEKLKKLEEDALETKAELKVTKDLLESANAEIIELKTALATKEGLNKENKADPQPKKNKEKLQGKSKNQKAEKRKIEKPAEVNDVPLNVDLHNAYGKLPYDSLVELETFADELKVLEFYDHIKNRLLFIGGDGVTEWITAVLNAIMTSNLQGQISLTGKGTTKVSFLTDYKQVANLIHDVVRSTNETYKDKCGNIIIGKLLRSRSTK